MTTTGAAPGSHMDYVVEAVVELFEHRDRIRGLRIVDSPRTLRHFMARFEVSSLEKRRWWSEDGRNMFHRPQSGAPSRRRWLLVLW